MKIRRYAAATPERRAATALSRLLVFDEGASDPVELSLRLSDCAPTDRREKTGGRVANSPADGILAELHLTTCSFAATSLTA